MSFIAFFLFVWKLCFYIKAVKREKKWRMMVLMQFIYMYIFRKIKELKYRKAF